MRILGQGSEGQVFMVRTNRSTHKFDKAGTVFAMKTQKKSSFRHLSAVSIFIPRFTGSILIRRESCDSPKRIWIIRT